MNALWRRWQRYWFAPASVASLAACRILIVGLQLFKLLHHDWHAEFLDHVTLPDTLFHPLPVLRLITLPLGWGGWLSLIKGNWYYRPALGTLDICYWGTVIAGVLAFIGLWTNRSLIFFAIGNMFMIAYLYSFGDFHHPEAIMMIALAILALSPAGGALSLDDIRRRFYEIAGRHRFKSEAVLDRQSEYARWPLLLIQWVYALVYLSCALSKLRHGGLTWMNGQTLQYYLMEDGLRWNKPLGILLSQHPTVVRFLSWFTVLFEGTFFVAVLVPSVAWVYVLMGLGLHFGIYVTMDAAFFQLMMIYCVFLPWADWMRKAGEYFRTRSSMPIEIFYDGLCPLCMRSMAVLQSFDWFGLLVLSDLEVQWPRLASKHPEISLEACRQEMHVLLADGSLSKGFFAYREIIKRLPPLWPFLSVLYFPFSAVIGPRVYQWIAIRRPRNHVCTVETCPL